VRRAAGISLLLLAACEGAQVVPGDGPSEACPGWRLSDQELVLSETELSAPTQAVLTITNHCLEDEGDLAVELSLSGEPSFELGSSQLTIAAGESDQVVVTYTAESYTQATAELELLTNIDQLGTITVPITATAAADQDQDGVDALEAGGEDCDDSDPEVFPGAREVWYDGVDQDCAGDSDYDQDGDGQERKPEGTDCDDLDPQVLQGADEIPDLVDNDCDGWVDEDSLRPGDVLVTELMSDPVAVLDTDGEWFELLNTTDRIVDLVGWTVLDFDGDSFTVQESLQIPPGVGRCWACRAARAATVAWRSTTSTIGRRSRWTTRPTRSR